MSRSQDLVAIATGSVLIGIETLSPHKRLRLFGELAAIVQEHYEKNPAGENFISWQEESFGETLTSHSVRRYSLALDESLYPNHEKYNKRTKISALTGNYFRLPEFEAPKNGEWKIGDTKLVTRFCLTHDGVIYLEWYLGRVTEMWKDHPNLPSKIVVIETRYIAIPHHYSQDSIPDELRTLLGKDPSVLYSFGFNCLSLLRHEEEECLQRAQLHAKTFSEFRNIGRIFGITYP